LLCLLLSVICFSTAVSGSAPVSISSPFKDESGAPAPAPAPASEKHFGFLAHHDIEHYDIIKAKTTNIDELKIMCESRSNTATFTRNRMICPLNPRPLHKRLYSIQLRGLAQEQHQRKAQCSTCVRSVYGHGRATSIVPLSAYD
jgi:hypothetical protein